eukprot:COSAG06_NODE_576_length_14051_cov_5.354644_6_plen_70_part_00
MNGLESWMLVRNVVCLLLAVGADCVSDIRYFISYLKKPDNNERWHEGKIEQGNDEDWVGENRDGATDWI